MKDSGDQLITEPAARPVAIVGIGASAGGLDPLKQFFTRTPDDTGIGYVVIQHMAPEHHSMLAEILAKQTVMRVCEIEDGVTVAPDTVYVLSPSHDLHIEHGRLRLGALPVERLLRQPIDTFFRSLAQDQQENAVGIVLSGTGSDGVQGIREIKENGGMVMAQHPDEATHDAMPRNVVLTGLADYVLPVAELPTALVRYVQYNELFADQDTTADLSTQQVAQVLHLLHSQSAHDFHHYKHSTLRRRVQRRMSLKGIGSLDDYLYVLRDSPEELQALAHDLLICVTAFFRNAEAWEALRSEVLAKLIATKLPKAVLRIWVAGCATGEEAYSMAMLITELLEDRHDIKVQIFATDLSTHALRIARAATYPENIRADVSPERLRRFFVQDDEGAGYRLIKSIRDRVIFAAQDIKNDPPFSRLDVISCRNLLIYLEPEAQKQILARFHFALNEDGYLFLGSAETPNRLEEGFSAVVDKWRIYRRTFKRAGLGLEAFAPRSYVLPLRTLTPALTKKNPSYHELVADLTLKHSAAAVLLLNERWQPLYVGGDSERFLTIPNGEQRYSVLDMARPGLHMKLRAALKQAVQEQRIARFQKVRVKQPDGTSILLNGLVEPVQNGVNNPPLLFVKLTEEARETGAADSSAATVHDNAEMLVRQLERELLESREELSSTIEQLEQANEELRAANEEALSVNEELQSGTEELEASKEELQSLNEELNTLNAQLEDNLRELAAANDDLDNLLSSTRIAVLFLDTQLHVRNFTPEAVTLFRLIRSDIGRPIGDLQHAFSDADTLLHEARQVLKTLTPLQEEVSTEGGAWYLRRLLPYRTRDNRIEGVVVTFYDITSLKQAQRQLADREARLRLLTDALPVLISYIDQEEKYQYVNAGYQDWFNLASEAIIGRTVRDVIGGEAYARVRDNTRAALAGERISMESELPYRYGGKRYVSIEYVPHRSPTGQVLGYYALIQDIAARKQAEQALRAAQLAAEERARELEVSKDVFDAMMEHIPMGITIADAPDVCIRAVSRWGREMLGKSRETLEGIPVELHAERWEVYHADGLTPARNEELPLTRATQQGETVIEEEWVLGCSNATRIPILCTAGPIRDKVGKIIGGVIGWQDITERKHIEDALRDIAERFRTLADNIDPLAWMANGKGWIFWYNQRWFDYTGTTLDEMQGWGWRKVHHPDHVDKVVAKISHCFRTGKRWEDTFPLRAKDGSYRWFLARAIPIRNERGKVLRWLGTNTDITERMQMEDALRRADQRKDEFLATLSHELRNPLAPIRTGLQLLQLAGDDRATAEKVQAMMERQTRQLIRLVDDLLDVSRITRGKVTLQQERVALAEILHSAIETMQPFLAEREQTLDVTLPDKPVFLSADSTRLAQVFANLLHNAANYSEKGSRIWLTVVVQAQQVMIAVRDAGIGISAAMLSHVFELFAQEDRSLERAHRGLGIGLTLVKSLVELHGGRVTAHSKGRGQGSEFIVWLPLAEVEPAIAKPDQDVAARAVVAKRILVVDDNEDAAQSIGLLLESSGYEVHLAYNGEQALEMAAACRPDVVLLDLDMPRLNGYDTARRLRQEPWGRDVLLVALTGWGQDGDRQRTEETGFDHHLVKPVDVAVVLALLNKTASAENTDFPSLQ